MVKKSTTFVKPVQIFLNEEDEKQILEELDY